jgi:nitrous oxidase accessory protein NosD
VRTVRRAVSVAASGGTIVLRGGTYRESVEIASKRLTLQPHPGEAAWLSGTDVVTGWVADGSAWRRDGWTHELPRGNFDPNLVDPAHPMAGSPEMVFIDGRPLREVGSRGAVASGTFFLDRAADRLYVGSDPAGHQVEASVRGVGLNVRAAGSVIRGLGFRGYGTSPELLGAVQGYADDLTFDNNVFEHNAAGGTALIGSRITYRHNTARDNGQIGVVASRTNNLVFSGNHLDGNNTERFYGAAAAGGFKLGDADNVTISENLAEDNAGHGLWADIQSYNVNFLENIARRNGAAGIFFEWSRRAVIASNVTAQNSQGLLISESSDVEIWNNTIADNGRTLEIYGNVRVPLPKNITVRNNIISHGPRSHWPAVVVVSDVTFTNSGFLMNVTTDHNAYYRSSTSRAQFLVEWANWPIGTLHTFALADYRQKVGGDRNGIATDNTPTDPYVVDTARGNYERPAGSPAIGKGQPLPDHIANLLGLMGGVPVDIGAF